MDFIETENAEYSLNDIFVEPIESDITENQSPYYSNDGMTLAGPEVQASDPAVVNDIESQNPVVLQSGSDPGAVAQVTDPDPEQVQEPTEGLDKIYNLLSERLPEPESETENLEEETETVTLSDIQKQIDDIRVIESESASQLQQISDNLIIASNNNYHMDIYQLAIMSAIFGGIAIGLLFRKIH